MKYINTGVRGKPKRRWYDGDHEDMMDGTWTEEGCHIQAAFARMLFHLMKKGRLQSTLV